MSIKNKLGFLLDEMRDTRKSLETIAARMVCKEDFRLFQNTLHNENETRDKKIEAHEAKLASHAFLFNIFLWTLRTGLVAAFGFAVAFVGKHFHLPIP